VSLSVPDWLFLGLAYTAGAATLAITAFALTGWEFPDNPLAGTRFGGRVGSPRRRGNVRRYLDAIGERYVEDEVVADVRVEFYLPDRDVAITLSQRAADHLRQSSTYVVYCEPRLRVDQLGDRLPFETPTVERGRGPGGGRRAPGGARGRTAAGRATGSRSGRRSSRQGRTARAGGSRQQTKARVSRAFRTLGVSRDASVEEVKSAYREKVKDVHPDHGGSEEAFSRVQDAYATAKQHAD